MIVNNGHILSMLVEQYTGGRVVEHEIVVNETHVVQFKSTQKYLFFFFRIHF